jgi:transcriptional regulator with XRE-family HTH domain
MGVIYATPSMSMAERQHLARTARDQLAVRDARDGADDFGLLLRLFRERTTRTRSDLARTAHCDPSYLTRIELGDRNPPSRRMVEALATELYLTPFERNRFMTAAGYVPQAIAQLGSWDRTLQAVADVLADRILTEAERDEFGQVVRVIARRYRPVR